VAEDDFNPEDEADRILAEDDAGEVETLRAENAALKEQALRYAAEAENTTRRAEREVNDARAYAIQKFGRDLLDAADSLSRALQAAPKDAADPALKNLVLGIEMTEKALQTAFERNGLKKVDPARGEAFDPHKHQAVMEQPSEGVGPGAVVMVMQAGYELFGRLVRPAMVAVTPKGAAAAPAPASASPYAAAEGANDPSIDTKA
jgi:molecular chaperone GrpE